MGVVLPEADESWPDPLDENDETPSKHDDDRLDTDADRVRSLTRRRRTYRADGTRGVSGAKEREKGGRQTHTHTHARAREENHQHIAPFVVFVTFLRAVPSRQSQS